VSKSTEKFISFERILLPDDIAGWAFSQGRFLSRYHIYSDTSLDHAREKGIIVSSDATLIQEYIGELQASRNISVGRKNKIVFTLVGWLRFVGQFDTLTIADIYVGISKLKAGTSTRGDPFKQNTLRDFVTILKSFTRWMIENGYSS
jgi:hypothetical protein